MRFGSSFSISGSSLKPLPCAAISHENLRENRHKNLRGDKGASAGLTGAAAATIPWGEAVRHAHRSAAKSLLPNFTLAAALTWLPLPLLHLTPGLGVGAFLVSCSMNAFTGLLSGKWPQVFRWLFK